MYQEHFGLRELPFGITPDTGFFFACRNYQEALNTLLVAVSNGEGFIKITGEVGTGKTLLCRKFLSSLNGDFVTAYIPNPYLQPASLLVALAEELGVELPAPVDQHQVHKALTYALLDFARKGKQVVVCLDEAQAMPTESLEAIRLLTNLETEKRKLLQVVLFGQPELDDRLAEPSIRQLRQRITFHYHLRPLNWDDFQYYVAHRLSVAGYCGGRLLSRPAMRRLFAASGGIPRLVNILTHKAMMAAYGQGRFIVRWAHVGAAARDTLGTRVFAGRTWAMGAMVLLAGFGLAWMVYP